MIKQEKILAKKMQTIHRAKQKGQQGKQVADKQIEGILNCTLFE